MFALASVSFSFVEVSFTDNLVNERFSPVGSLKLWDLKKLSSSVGRYYDMALAHDHDLIDQ